MNAASLKSQEIFLLNDFLSEAECKELVDRTEAIGYSSAPVTTPDGPVMMPDVRNNSRLMIEDRELADRLFQKARPLLPQKLPGGWEIVGLNELLRYYRYEKGQQFAPHYDGAFARNKTEQSQLTFMVYLNEGFEGGETKFYDGESLVVTPRCGSALVFVHRKLHEGASIISGRKYVLRSDVMYRRDNILSSQRSGA